MKRRTAVKLMALFLGALAWSGEIRAQGITGQLEGTWVNTDAGTRGVTKLKITSVSVSGGWRIQAWGKAHPQDSDWGTVPLHMVAPSVESKDYTHAFAKWEPGFKTTYMMLHLTRRQLSVETIDVFHDQSNRSNYRSVYVFQKETVPGEDCVSFDPQRAEVRQIEGRWKIVDGDHWLFDFESKRDEAEKALRIIKHCGMNQSCFVGRPDPSFTYMLVSGRAPEGSFPSDDCVSFSPSARRSNRSRDAGRSWMATTGCLTSRTNVTRRRRPCASSSTMG